MVQIGLIWLRIGDQWRALVNRFHKMLENSWVAAQLAAPQEGLSSVSKSWTVDKEWSSSLVVGHRTNDSSP
jgi:hypothetical protein